MCIAADSETIEVITATYLVPDENLHKPTGLSARLEELNKKADKLGVDPIEMTAVFAHNEYEYETKSDLRWFKDGSEEEQKWLLRYGKDTKRTGRVRRWFSVTITGKAPKFAGWRFAGTLTPLAQADGPAVNLLKSVPGGVEIPMDLRTIVGRCDHCHKVRRRNETYVVQHDDGTWKVVGRNCLRDFLGHKDPHALARWAEYLSEFNDTCRTSEFEGGGGGYTVLRWELRRFLGITLNAIRRFGWVSSVAAREMDKSSTASRVVSLLMPPSSLTPEHVRRERAELLAELEPTTEDEELVGRMIAWAATNTEASHNSYLANLQAIAKAESFETNATGFAASLVVAYGKANQIDFAAARRITKTDEWFGEVGKRLDFPVLCEKVLSLEGDYGVTGLHILVHAETGEAFSWFASGSAEWLEEGNAYKVRATVKSHDIYRGKKRTVLSRVSILEEQVIGE